jgi:ATP-dependent helicase/nuclease subunit B
LNLFEIPAELPFLDALAAGVLDAHRDAPPEALARATILLPTRRSARFLREAFLRVAATQALLLPRMRALAGLSTEDADELALPALLDLPPAVPALTRQAVLTATVQRLPPRHGGPATPEQAWALAGELATLFDEIALEEADPDLLDARDPGRFAEAWLARLEGLAPPEQAVHWQITTHFLRAVATFWAGWLRDAGLCDIGLRRVLALRAQTRAWAEHPPAHPVIAAGIGIGGTIPAAALLLKTLAGLPQGAVVLHGFGRATLAEHEAEIASSPTHPLASQARLLAALGATPRDVRRWPGCALVAPRAPAAREKLLDMALRPPGGMAAWTQATPATWVPGLPGLSALTAPDAQAEAGSIALSLRHALETPGARAALVTPDRELAQRVRAELLRHGVLADDSAGEKLGETPTGAFLRLLATCIAEDFAPVPLLALLKHRLASAGMARAEFLAGVHLLDRRVLRGARPEGGLAALEAAIQSALAEGPARDRAMALHAALVAAFGDAATLGFAPRPPADRLALLLQAAEALAASDDQPGGLRLYAAEEGEVLAGHLADLAVALTHLPPIAPRDWPALFAATLGNIATRSVRAAAGRDATTHPRIEILGLLEARLLSFDHVVLGALDETVWPLATEPGPWMSRPMRASFGLPEPETRIGRVAMDFCLFACAAPTAVLSRAVRRGGAPTVPARWLTRLATFLGGQGQGGGLALEASPLPAIFARLDQPARITPAPRPAPRPPRALRPKRISVTEVATLLADPYAFHARQVLRLRRLDDLDADVGAIDYGQIVHAALAEFIGALNAAPGGWPGDEVAEAAWEAAAARALAAQGPRPALAAFWRPRLARIGGFVRAMEAAARQGGGVAHSFCEQDGTLVLARPAGQVELRGRADRIDRLGDGSLLIFDYKTGTVPADSALQSGAAPQLPLEAAMAAEGGFGALGSHTVRGLTYWKLSGGDTPGETRMPVSEPEDVAKLAETALTSLHDLVDRFLLAEAPFIARPHPGRVSRNTDYDQLSRYAEWADAEDGE